MGAQEVTKVEAGTLFTAPEDGVYVTHPEFIRIVTALDSLDLERRKVEALHGVIAADSLLFQALDRQHTNTVEGYQELLAVYKARPSPSLIEKIGLAGLLFTVGYMVNELVTK